MRVIVLGSGVIGVTSAYYLAKHFPNITTDRVNDYAPQDDRLVTQRILH